MELIGGIGVIKSLNNILPRQALLTIYKSFIRPQLDYGDVIYDQPNSESLCQTTETVQYKAAFAITGARKGTSQAKLYKESGLEALKIRRWCRRLYMLYKVKTSGLPLYLSKYIPKGNHSYNTRLNLGGLKIYYCRTDVFKYFQMFSNVFSIRYFSICIFSHMLSEWNKLDLQICKANSLLSFKNTLRKLGRPVPNSCFNIHNPVGLKLLTRLRVGLTHLNDINSNTIFQIVLIPYVPVV